MAANLELSTLQTCFNGKNKNAIKGNVTVDVYMYYHPGGFSYGLSRYQTFDADMMKTTLICRERTLQHDRNGFATKGVNAIQSATSIEYENRIFNNIKGMPGGVLP